MVEAGQQINDFEMNPTNLLILGAVLPEPNSSAAGSRMLQLIEHYQRQGWKITFATAAVDSAFAANLSELGIKQKSILLNSSSFDEFVKELDPQIVLFDRFITEEQFGWRVAEQCPNALRILDTEDLHCLRVARQKALKQNRKFELNHLFNDHAKREIASIYRCDISLIISEYEMELLRSFFKVDKALLHYLPFMLDQLISPALPTEELHATQIGMSFEKRSHFVTIGNFRHPPNWDAVRYLKTTIWPLIKKKLPEIEMHIYGAYPTDKAFQLEDKKTGFLIKGRAKDVNEVVGKAKVMLAPLRFGAGIKGKLTDAMINGTPSVTTAIGAEAMHGNLAWNGAIENAPEKFAQAAVRLYTDKMEWKKAQQNGITIINKIYSKEKLGREFMERIEALRSNLETHRQQNFIGSMLMYHSMRSTQFMSKWIEEKNRIT